MWGIYIGNREIERSYLNFQGHSGNVVVYGDTGKGAIFPDSAT